MPTITLEHRIKLPATTYLACLEIIKSGLSSHSQFRMLNTPRIIMNFEEGVTRPNEPRHYPYFVVAEDKFTEEQLMGFAKRRKKILGEDYGKKESIVIVGSAELERHLLKFADAWTEKLEEIGELNDLEEEEQEVREEEFNQWLRKYLESYRQSEREKLVMGVLDPVWAELAEIPKSEAKAVEFAVNWSIETIFLYKRFKPYLSTSAASEYAEPLRGFYEIVIKEAMKNARGEEEIEKLKQEFEKTLEIEESKRY